MITIAFINSVAGYGSTGRLVEMLSETDGVKSRIYYGRKSAANDFKNAVKEVHSDDKHFYFGSPFSFASHMAATFLFDSHGFSSTAMTKRMVSDLDSFAPDIIHLHNLHGYYLNAEVLFDYLSHSHAKILWTLHDCWPFTGHCAHFMSVDCDQWKRKCYDCAALSHYPPTWNGSHVTRNYERKKELFTSVENDRMILITPCRWLKDESKQSFLKDYETRVIPNGVDFSAFQRKESDIRKRHGIEDRFVILAVAGQWYPEKGTDDLLKLKRVLPRDCVLVVIGAHGSFAGQLKSDNVIVIERTENIQELCEWYSAADVMINPTKEDTFPTVNIEAQACGCPVVTYNTGGSAEMLAETTGIAVKRGNVNALLNAVGSIRTKECIFRAEDCIANASQYSREAMLEAYRNLYLEVMER